MATNSHDLDQRPRIYDLPNSTYVVYTLAGTVLVNSPPETLKYVLAHGFEPPQIIVLPPDIPAGVELGSSGFVHHGINYASVEFLLYANFFGKSRRARVIAHTPQQAGRMHTILQETFNGPASIAEYGEDAWLKRECEATGFFPPLGRCPLYTDLVDIEVMDDGLINLDENTVLEADYVNGYYIFREHARTVGVITAGIESSARPPALAPARPLVRSELTLQFIGGSDGFDPTGITTCFLAYLSPDAQTQATLFDTAAFLRLRLGNLGLSPSQISEVVISHLHEDHIAGLPELLLMGDHRPRILTADIIYKSLLRVLGAMFDLPPEETATLFDYRPLNPGQKVQIGDRCFQSLYAIHTIPTIAVRANNLYYSGDMRYDEKWFRQLVQEGILDDQRRQDLLDFAHGADVLVQDADGGAIHTTITPELLSALADRGQRIILAHTSSGEIPAGWEDQVEVAKSGHVTGMGAINHADMRDVEVIETIEACPLFARLSLEKRIALTEKVVVQFWGDGDVIMDDGEPVDGHTYIVHSGLVEIWSADDEELVLVAGRGSTIGERGVLEGGDHGQRTNTAVARGDVQLLRIDVQTFKPIAEELGLREAFSRADWLWEHPLFKDLLWSTMLDLALDFQPTRYEKDETLFEFGEPGYESYFLVSGRLGVYGEDGTLINHLEKSGEFFGGRAVLYNRLRNASIRTLTTAEVWVLPAPALQRLHMVYSHLLLHLRAIESDRERNG